MYGWSLRILWRTLCSTERRSELAGVILRENSSTRLVARDDVPLRKAAQLSRTPGALLKFGAPGGVEYATRLR